MLEAQHPLRIRDTIRRAAYDEQNTVQVNQSMVPQVIRHEWPPISLAEGPGPPEHRRDNKSLEVSKVITNLIDIVAQQAGSLLSKGKF